MQLAFDFFRCVLALIAINSAAAALLESGERFYRVFAVEIVMAFAYAGYLVRKIRMAPGESLKYSRCYRFDGVKKVGKEEMEDANRMEERELSWDER
jgi:hypothetical protein